MITSSLVFPSTSFPFIPLTSAFHHHELILHHLLASHAGLVDLNVNNPQFPSNFLSKRLQIRSDVYFIRGVIQILNYKKRGRITRQPSGGLTQIFWGTAVVKWSGCHLASGNTSACRRGAVWAEIPCSPRGPRPPDSKDARPRFQGIDIECHLTSFNAAWKAKEHQVRYLCPRPLMDAVQSPLSIYGLVAHQVCVQVKVSVKMFRLHFLICPPPTLPNQRRATFDLTDHRSPFGTLESGKGRRGGEAQIRRTKRTSPLDDKAERGERAFKNPEP